MTVTALFRWVIAGLAGASALALASSAAAASDVQVTALDCAGHPRKIAIQNVGDTAQNLAGWKLLSDQPNETFDLGVVGSIAAGETVFVFNGHLAPATPEQSGGSWIYPWNYTPVYDETAFVLHEDGKDFLRIVDSSQFPWRDVSAVPCPGTLEIPPLQQPATPTPTQSSADAGSQNPSQPDSSSGQTVTTESGGASQNVAAGNTATGSTTQSTTQTGNASGQVAGGPASGTGALAAGSGAISFAAQPLPVALFALAIGAALALIGALTLHRALGHRRDG